MGRAAFLDRDGVLNFRHPEDVMRYIARLEDFRLLPGAIAGIAALSKAGYRVFIVSNQRGVARGLVSPAELDRIDAHLIAEAEAAGGSISGIYYCMHDDDAGCDCRKPAPGLLLRALRDFPDVERARSFMVGDTDTDRRAAEAAGVPFHGLETNGNLFELLKANSRIP